MRKWRLGRQAGEKHWEESLSLLGFGGFAWPTIGTFCRWAGWIGHWYFYSFSCAILARHRVSCFEKVSSRGEIKTKRRFVLIFSSLFWSVGMISGSHQSGVFVVCVCLRALESPVRIERG